MKAAAQQRERQVVVRQFVGAHGDTLEVLQFAKKTFNPVAVFVKFFAVPALFQQMNAGRDNAGNALSLDVLKHIIINLLDYF